MIVARMCSQDLAEVADLEQRCFSVPWSFESLRQSLERPEYLFLVAQKEGKVVGYAGLVQVMEEGYITNIAVDERYRGQGVGRLLTETLLTEGKKLGMKEFTLEVRVGNAAAIHIYESVGFVGEGVRKRFYERPAEDALIMWKREPER